MRRSEEIVNEVKFIKGRIESMRLQILEVHILLNATQFILGL